MIPSETDLWFLPLGGCGEIGMNLNLFGHNEQWLMVDCGVTFAKPGEGGPQVQMADPEFIVTHRDRLAGMLITHAHEDHIGAVAHLWPQLRCPVYVTPFAAALLRNKLAEAGLLSKVELRMVHAGMRDQVGTFDVEWLGLTHSTPESNALMIRTAAGSVLHTGDWKLDFDPVVGEAFQPQRFASLQSEVPTAMVCDSTNALESERSVSEGRLHEGLLELVQQAPGRVIVGCFGSNVARLRTLAAVAHSCGRYPALIGRSLHNYYGAARAAGVWGENLGFVEADHLGYLPPSEVFAVATGSQGESRAALSRLASNNHPAMELAPGDTLLLSSRTIPGNEEAVGAMLEQFERLGVVVIEDAQVNKPIHASGHPSAAELGDMYGWVQPTIAIPVHGEAAHMQANASVAKQAGVKLQLTGENGDLFILAPQPGVRRAMAKVGRVGLERGQLVPVV